MRVLGLDRADDSAIWQYARDNVFILVSLDSDFADMAAHLGPPPKLIWLRCGNQPTVIFEMLLRRYATVIAQFHEDDAPSCLEIFTSER